MNRGFYTIMAAQFLSSLADNALLIAAIALLRDMGAASWMTPMLKLFFVISYVMLAAFVGAFADALPKARVMLITNAIKIGGCLLMFVGTHPLLAYAVVASAPPRIRRPSTASSPNCCRRICWSSPMGGSRA
jgi:MFS family permease